MAIVLGVAAGFVGLTSINIFINNKNKQIQDAKKEAKQLKDVAFFKSKYREISQQIIQQISKRDASQIQQYDLSHKLEKKANKKDIIFLGITSSGKSSLINTIFETKLAVGVGETTESTSLAFEQQRFRIWDAVGSNTDFQFYDMDNIAFFCKMDAIFILYRTTPSACEHMIRLIWGLRDKKYEVYFVRTCCDQFGKQQHRTLEEELKRDQKILQDFGVQKPIILTSSTKDGFDNIKIKDKINELAK